MLLPLLNFGHLFLPLLESSEVVLDKEGGIELTNCDVIIPCACRKVFDVLYTHAHQEHFNLHNLQHNLNNNAYCSANTFLRCGKG